MPEAKFIEVYTKQQQKQISLANELLLINKLTDEQERELKNFIARYKYVLLKNLVHGCGKQGYSMQVGSCDKQIFDYHFQKLGTGCIRTVKTNNNRVGLNIFVVYTIKDKTWYDGKNDGPYKKIISTIVPVFNKLQTVTKKLSYKSIKFLLNIETDIVHIVWKSKSEIYDKEKKCWFDSN
jgi:hypothetical protein